jgi:hypothetical protein
MNPKEERWGDRRKESTYTWAGRSQMVKGGGCRVEREERVRGHRED